jgi:hypothetical protein
MDSCWYIGTHQEEDFLFQRRLITICEALQWCKEQVLRSGWFCKAYVKKNLPWSKKAYYMKCVMWKDKKQVVFLSTNQVGLSQGLTAQKHVKKVKKSKNY